ncbi:MAG: transposase [Syntrophobacterales bacterium]|nr:transposase [Syntrophobacterales bacterium]
MIERYQRRESSVEEALIEMYLAGVSVRRVEDITEALWGTRVSPGTVSNLNKKIYSQIEEWRNRPLKGVYPFVYLVGIWLKRSLRRIGRKRLGARLHRSQRRRLPGDHRGSGRSQGGQGELEKLP